MKPLLFAFWTLLVGGGLACAEEPKPLAIFLELPWRYVIGGYEKGQWLGSEGAGKLLEAPKTPFRVYTLKGELAPISAGRAGPEADVCPDVWMAEVSPKPSDMEEAIGVNATWNPMPRTATFADTTQGVYVNAVSDLLVNMGIKKPKVKIRQLLRVDLEGDGTEEVLMTATHYE